MENNEKYQQLFKEKQRVDNELNDLLSHSIVCNKCSYCKDYRDIDLSCLYVEFWYSYSDSGTDFYYDCNECNEKARTVLTRKQFEKILEVHETTYHDWLEKYPKNYTRTSI